MQKPQVKGTLLYGISAALRIARSEERITEDELNARLSKPALDVLASKVQIGLWYPLEAYREVLDLYWDLFGHGRPEFMRNEGERAARELVEHGVYRAFASTGGGPASADAVVRRARLTCQMTEMIYDFVELDVEFDREAHALTLVYSNVAGFSEAMIHGTHGFLHGLTWILSGMDVPETGVDCWRVVRASADSIRFTLDLFSLVPRAPVG